MRDREKKGWAEGGKGDRGLEGNDDGRGRAG
jgi:hypothetical protein